MAATDFYGNLGKIIHDILGAANKIYRDMADVGDHKKRAKYRYRTSEVSQPPASCCFSPGSPPRP